MQGDHRNQAGPCHQKGINHPVRVTATAQGPGGESEGQQVEMVPRERSGSENRGRVQSAAGLPAGLPGTPASSVTPHGALLPSDIFCC